MPRGGGAGANWGALWFGLTKEWLLVAGSGEGGNALGEGKGVGERVKGGNTQCRPHLR